MAFITDILNTIKNARKGKDMRQAIYDGIQQCYKDATGHPDSVAAVVERLKIEKGRIDELATSQTFTGNYTQSNLVFHAYRNAITGDPDPDDSYNYEGTSGKHEMPICKIFQEGTLDFAEKQSNEKVKILKEGLYIFELRIFISGSGKLDIEARINDVSQRYNAWQIVAQSTEETKIIAYILYLKGDDVVSFYGTPGLQASVRAPVSDVNCYVLDWIGKAQISDCSKEISDIRVGEDGAVYGTAGEAVRKQIGNLTEDLVNSTKDAWTWDGDFSKATEMFKPTDIVGNNYPFKSGYVDSVKLSVFAVSGNDATLFVTDTNRKILFKTTKIIKNSDLVIPVNKSFDVDFYVFVSYSGLKFYNSTNVYSDKWAGLSFDNYGSYLVGDVLPIFNNNGKVGFSFKVKYATINGKIIENTNNINKYHTIGVKIVSETDNAHFSIDEKGVIYSRKIGTASGCYPCFFDAKECITFEMTNDETWIIVSTNDTGKFVSLGFKGDGIIFASFNADGSLISVDYTRSYLVKTWLNSKITFVWNDEYFCSIYRNEHLIYKFDIRHICTDIITHNFGVGAYSNMQDGIRVRIIDSTNKNKIFLDDVCVLGDSFSDNTRDSLGEGTFYFTRWYEYARELNHIKTVYNYGFGGTCMSPSVSGENSFYNRMQTMYSEHNNPSAVFVLGGTNDYHNDVPLGTINDMTTDTFYGTLNKMCEYFKENFHTSKVVFCTPIMRVSPSNGKTETTPANNQTNSNGNSLEQFASAMIEVCHKWALPCFDAYHNSGICPQARNTQNFAWFMNDGIHMKQNGHRRLGMRFGKFAKQFL